MPQSQHIHSLLNVQKYQSGGSFLHSGQIKIALGLGLRKASSFTLRSLGGFLTLFWGMFPGI